MNAGWGPVRLNANRKVTGVLRGYDQFMNLVLENAVEEVSAENRVDIGTVVRVQPLISSIFRSVSSQRAGKRDIIANS